MDMHKGVDEQGGVKAPVRRALVLCGCGVPLGRRTTVAGAVSRLRECPRCDIWPPLIAA